MELWHMPTYSLIRQESELPFFLFYISIVCVDFEMHSTLLSRYALTCLFMHMQNPMLYSAFAQLLQCAELTVGLDRVCMKPPAHAMVICSRVFTSNACTCMRIVLVLLSLECLMGGNRINNKPLIRATPLVLTRSTGHSERWHQEANHN